MCDACKNCLYICIKHGLLEIRKKASKTMNCDVCNFFVHGSQNNGMFLFGDFAETECCYSHGI